MPPTMEMPRPCVPALNISTVLSGPQCFEGELGLVAPVRSSPLTERDLAEFGLVRLDCRLSDLREVRGAASGGVRGVRGVLTRGAGGGSVELSSVVTDFRLSFSKF